MNYKVFIQKTDEIVNNMDIEELRNCIHTIARKIPETKRDEFFLHINDFHNQNDQDDILRKGICESLMNDKEVKNKVSEIYDIFNKISDRDVYISASGYEDYSNGYWQSDWIWEYEDSEGIGRIIEDAVLFAHDCMNDLRYKEALSIYKLVMNTDYPVEYEDGGDCFELSFKEMEEEGLISVNIYRLALEVLYTEYQLQTPDRRAERLYSYFNKSCFKNISIEDIFSLGREELQDMDMFLQLWIDLLMKQQGDSVLRLLNEAILLHKGLNGLKEEARRGYKEHPGLYLSAMVEYEKVHDYREVMEIGKEALDYLEIDLRIRGEIALKTSQAFAIMNHNEFMKRCWYEAFNSNSTIINYLRLFSDIESVASYKTDAEKRIEKLKVVDTYNKKTTSETIKNTVSEIEYKYLCFFSGQFDKVQYWCMEQKKPLGWTGKFIGHGVELMLLYLYAGNNLRKAGKEIAYRISRSIGFNDETNLVFIRKNMFMETDYYEQNNREIFWNIFSLWKLNYIASEKDIILYIEWLESVIDKRIIAIMDGKFRNRYDDVALLAAALGEVKESLGQHGAKYIIADKYTKIYSRRTNFKKALENYMD